MFRVLLLAASLLAVSGAAAADTVQRPDLRQRLGQNEASERVRDGENVPMLRVTGDARRRYPDMREMAGAYTTDGPNPMHVVRIITADGVLKELYYDARTGRFLYER
jgi:hypothetical protein